MSFLSSHSKYFSFIKNVLVGTLVLLLLFGNLLPAVTFADDAPPTDTSSQTAPSPTDTPPADTSIATGDAAAAADTSTTANTNEVTTAPDPSATPPEGTPQESTTTLTNEGSTESSTTETVSASTGGNDASGNSGGSTITTGNAAATGNTLNVVNVNVLNSNGFLLLLNSLFGNIGSINLSDIGTSAQNGTCTLCTPLQTTVSNEGAVSITNDVVVRSSTGGNSANNNGSSTVSTGDAYAAANVLNVANTNIVNSNYMMVVLNNAGSWNGNFVLPNGDFFKNFLMGNGTSLGNTTLSNDGLSTINNSVSVGADTGGNSANNNGGNSLIQTGDAFAGANVYNQANQNLFGGSSVILLFRVFGNWSGGVFNAPPGILWQQTPNGVELYSDPHYDGGSSNTPCATCDSSTTLQNSDETNIKNNVEVYALTGENKVNGNKGDGIVQTGNAYAGANVVNMVNTNVYGRNWILAIVNILGDWSGSISFGEPDLWLGTKASITNGAAPNSPVSYTFTIANHGNADAHNVKLHGLFSNQFITFVDGGSGVGDWDVGDIPAGTTKEVSYNATVSGDIPNGDTPVDLTAHVSAHEPDHNDADNTDTITVVASKVINPQDRGYQVVYTQDPNIEISKTNDAPAYINASTTVNYTITLKNKGGEAYSAVLQDIIKTDTGQYISEKEWDLDTIFPNEQITVTYALTFKDDAPAGVYVNHAQIHALGRNPSFNPLYGVVYESPEATSTVVIMPTQIVVGGGFYSGFPEKPERPLPPVRAKEMIQRLNHTSVEDVHHELSKLLPLAFSSDGGIPPAPNGMVLGAGTGFALPHPDSIDLLILVFLLMLLFANKITWRDLEVRLKNRFASFL